MTEPNKYQAALNDFPNCGPITFMWRHENTVREALELAARMDGEADGETLEQEGGK